MEMCISGLKGIENLTTKRASGISKGEENLEATKASQAEKKFVSLSQWNKSPRLFPELYVFVCFMKKKYPFLPTALEMNACWHRD